MSSDADKLPRLPALDGLRAIAVGAVLLGHAQLGLPGGYVGVDVFFVISGFLIARLVAAELAAGTFRLADFWERRIRRIIPALAVVAAFTFAAGWALLLPDDLVRWADSLTALGAGASNVFFAETSGYFDRGAATKPLLHTWSLAVEGQFYLLFPLLLVLCHRRRLPRLATIGCLLGLSLVASAWLTALRPNLAFYSLPTRGWELLLGAAILGAPAPSRFAVRWAEFAGWLGLGLVLFSCVSFSPATPMPGFAASVPCAGAALLIWSHQRLDTSIQRVLAWRPLVWVGAISYSLYLWHWPLLALVEYWNFSPHRMAPRVLALAVAVLAAVVSWRWIERPVRQRRVLASRRSVYVFAAIVSVTFIGTGCWVRHLRGAASRLDATSLGYARTAAEPAPFAEVSLREAEAGRLIDLGFRGADAKGEVLVWGDSHAMVLLPLLGALGEESRLRVWGAVRYGLPPLVAAGSARPDAEPFAEAALRFATARKVRGVILIAAWAKYPGPSSEALVASLQTTIGRLRAAGIPVWVVSDVPVHPYPIPKALIAQRRFGVPAAVGLTPPAHREAAAAFEKQLEAAGVAADARLDPTPFFDSGGDALDVTADGASLYVDAQHLSSAGAVRLRPLFEPLLREIAARAGQSEPAK